MDWILKYWVEVVFSLIMAGAGVAFRHVTSRIKRDEAEQRAIKNGMQALLRDRIYQAYNHYLDKGYYPIYARDNTNSLLNEYKALGGNGTVPDLMKRLAQLPTDEEREEYKS